MNNPEESTFVLGNPLIKKRLQTFATYNLLTSKAFIDEEYESGDFVLLIFLFEVARLRILVACEQSQIVTKEFRANGPVAYPLD